MRGMFVPRFYRLEQMRLCAHTYIVPTDSTLYYVQVLCIYIPDYNYIQVLCVYIYIYQICYLLNTPSVEEGLLVPLVVTIEIVQKCFI